MKKIILIVSLIIFTSPLYARVKIFLYPKIEVEKVDIKLSDIARIERYTTDNQNLSNIVIPSDYLRDGYIDSKEIRKVLKKYEIRDYTVFGNTTHVINKYHANQELASKASSVKKGDTVTVIIRRKAISIEMIGVSLVDAEVGNSVFVELNKTKKLKGILKGGKVVEVIL